LCAAAQECLRGVVKGVGGLDHAAWRAFDNDRGAAAARGFVDGDLVEQFLDLRRESAERVAAAMGGGVTVEELSRVVDDISRSCH